MQTQPNPKYFPIERGEYAIAPGLRPLGYDFGNGDFDKKVFQITSNFKTYRQNKLECRKERLSKYFLMHDLGENRVNVFTRYMFNQLVTEYPNIFKFDGIILHCLHTGDKIAVDPNYDFVEFMHEGPAIEPKVEHIIDALSLQVEEDIVLMCRSVEKDQTRDYVGMLHLCSASHWAAEDKVGRNFFDIHIPIPGIDKINRVADRMVETMINKGPYVRFIWSFVTDQRLNHHPMPPPEWDLIKWRGRTFNKELAIPFHFRIERQITWGFPEVECALFTIGVSFMSGAEVKANDYQREQLISALKSMTPESRVYKGVDKCFDELIGWLEN
jgi:hypothetical protein